MTSPSQNQSKTSTGRAAADAGTVGRDWLCTYPNEERERNQIYTLLCISNSANEQEEKPLECANATGWEEVVQGWSRTLPFACLQLQKRARKTRTSESVHSCLFCLDLMQVVDKGSEPDRKSSAGVTPGGIPEKQTLLCSSTTLSSPPVADESKKDNYKDKLHSTQTSEGEKKRLSLKEAQAFLNENKTFLMRETQIFQVEKKAVPIREYSILSLGKPTSAETLKCKDTKSLEPVTTGSLGDSGATSLKSSPVVLPPLKHTLLKHALDLSPTKSKLLIFQANEKAPQALSETISCAQVCKTRGPRRERGMHPAGGALKEPVKIHYTACFAPEYSKTSCFSGTTEQCCWHCALLPDRKITPISNSIALRRKSRLSSMHFLHTKRPCDSKAEENWDSCARGRSCVGAKQGNESETQEVPLLSGLFSSLTVSHVAMTASPSKLT